jgi:hypothetical protein
MDNIGPSPIVGVFKEQSKADHAVEELKMDKLSCKLHAWITRKE